MKGMEAPDNLEETIEAANYAKNLAERNGNLSTQELKNSVFEYLLNKRIVTDFTEALEDIGYINTGEEENTFYGELAKYSASEQHAILSLPFEIRKRFLQRRLEEGIPISDLPKVLHDYAEKNCYTIGYHVSPDEIPVERKGDGSCIWRIKGTEPDHRDADRMMAYYSLDYGNLFTKNRGENIYMVRANTSGSSAHKRDTSNNWGRADELSIISKVEDASKIDEIIDKTVDLVKKDQPSA